MNRGEKLQLLELQEEKLRRVAENAIDGYYPDEGPLRRELYAKHMEFFAAGATYRERCAMCANRVGTSATIIDTPLGPQTVGDLYAAGEEFEVYARPGVVAKAYAPFKKTHKEPCLRIEMSDGKWFECAFGHRILTTEGWLFAADYVQLSRLQGGYAPDRTLSSWGYGPTARDVDGLHLSQKSQGFQGNCSGGCHPCDGQPHDASDNVGGFLPLPSDVPGRSPAWWRGDGLGAKYTNTHRQVCDRLSNLDVDLRLSGLFAGWSDLIADTTVQLLSGLHLVVRPQPVGGVGLLPQGGGGHQYRMEADGNSWLNRAMNNTQRHVLSSPQAVAPPLRGLGSGQKLKIELGRNPLKTSDVNGSHIEAVYFIGAHDVYDFTVEEHHTYTAGGVIHHNTEGMGGYETALHLTGIYPDWWPGRRFNKPISGWAAGKTNETTRDIVQRKLMGPMGELGTGLIRKSAIIHWTRKAGVHDLMDTVQIQHSSGGISQLGLKSYQQGRDSFEGTEQDLIWDDEEPPEDIYGEQLIRTATTNGIMMVTFTPLEGMSRVVMGFMPQENRLEV